MHLASRNRRVLVRALVPLVAVGAIVTVLIGVAPNANAVAGDPLWNVECGPTHFAPDDPIVFPGVPGASHMHTFFSNVTTNADSTPASIRAGSSNCINNMGEVDHSAYWVPSLERKNADGTSTIIPAGDQNIVVYYRRAGGANGPKVTPFPPGLVMIAGNSKATTPQSTDIIAWDCGDGGPESAGIINCTDPKNPVQGDVTFPSCWDGVHLDSADHKSHMAYPDAKGICPADHPVSVPQVGFELHYDITGGPNDLFLSSGGIYSFHGDFMNGWDNRAQNALIGGCLNTPNDCGAMQHPTATTLHRDCCVDGPAVSINMNDYDSSPGTTIPGSSGEHATTTTTARATTTTVPKTTTTMSMPTTTTAVHTTTTIRPTTTTTPRTTTTVQHVTTTVPQVRTTLPPVSVPITVPSTTPPCPPIHRGWWRHIARHIRFHL